MQGVVDAGRTRAQRRVVETSTRLVTTARRWVAERGLGGFTVDELCAEVGISRRTFFNHFQKKEHAVLGIRARDVAHAQAIARFRRGDGPVLDALVELAVERWSILGLTPDHHEAVVAAVTREPRLLAHLIAFGDEAIRHDTELAADRLGVPADDPVASTAVHVVHALVRAAARDYFHGEADGDFDFATRIRARAADLRRLTAPDPRTRSPR